MIDRFTILGGSSVYTPEFLLSLISHNIHVGEFVLYGRPGKKLDVVSQFCQRVVDRSGFPSQVRASTDLEEAVDGAKYVLNHIRVGGMKASLRDESIPPQEGMIGDETLGAGGLTNALRTLPVVLDLAGRVEAVNPECVFINLTDPVGIVVEALNRHTALKVVGVCDMPGDCIKKVARILGREPAELWFNFIGLNHFGWIQDVRLGKQSCMTTLLERLEHHKDNGFDYDLIQLFRMIPTRSVSLYFHRDAVLKRQRSCARYEAEILYEAEKQILKQYAEAKVCELPEKRNGDNSAWYEETITPLIEALESPTERDFVLCVPNNGSIRDLPEKSSVEVPVHVRNSGVEPCKVGDCPHFLRGLFIAQKESERHIVEAACHRSYEHALQSLAINPYVPSVDAARRYLDRVLHEEQIQLHR